MAGDASTADGPGPTLHPRHKTWLEARGLRSDIAERLGVTTRRDDRGAWLVFPYQLDGRLVNRKFRFTAEKRHEMEKGGKLCLWNAECLRSDRVAEHGASVIITEGEFDAIAAIQSGFVSTVSIPNGGSVSSGDPFTSKSYSYLWESQADLERVKEFILATDGDATGQAIAHDLASVLGPERCRFVVYPEGTKDLNEVLVSAGTAGVTRVLNSAKPYPVKGLYSLSDMPEAPPVSGMATGIDCLDEHMSIVLGTLTVFTGYANMGKTTVLDTILAHAIDQNVRCCVASFETPAKPILRDGIAKALLGCSDIDYDRHEKRFQALAAIDDRLRIITNSLDEDLELDIDGYLELARIATIRDGCRIHVLDPWNELEHKRGKDETGTDYIGRAIRKVKAFARRYNVAFWIVAHPTKPAKGVNAMPSLYDVSDSANWSNKADYGLVYHRKDKTKNEAELAVVKVRKGLPGHCGMQMVKFDHRISRVNGMPA